MAGPTERSGRRATYQDVLDAPEGLIAELIDGRLHLQPRPAKPHTRVHSRLAMLLGPPFELGRGGPGGWWILYEPEIHFGPDVLVPDLAGWRLSITPHFDETLPYYEERPSWVGEVLSPSTARTDRLLKLDVYARAGVEHAWLVEPRDRIVEVFRNEGGAWLRVAAVGGDEAVPLPPFEEVPLELDLLWGGPARAGGSDPGSETPSTE